MKIIAFYLPQFHAFPENDEWWGKGFTEWTNTKKAVPLYKNHYEPREPLDSNYYCLLDEKVMERQIELAHKYGIYGFCFYHYWFGDGHLLMEKPIEMFLKNKALNQKFCISWANETWSRCWDGSDNQILIKQEHGSVNTWKKHFYYLLDYFKDERYIWINGKPLFILYKPEIFPEYKKMFKLWEQLAIENGLPGITFAIQGAIWNNISGVDDSDIDFRIMYEPGFTGSQELKTKGIRYDFITKVYKIFSKIAPNIHVRLYSYREACLNIVNRRVPSEKYLPGFFINWDNTPRKGSRGASFVGSTPEVYGYFLDLLIKKTRNEYKKDYIFINAWNEWAEGCYLEPDTKFKYGYLEATKEALEKNNEFPDYME